MLAVSSIIVVFTPIGDRPLTAFFSTGNIPAIDFQTLELANSPNQYLLCPKGYCITKPNAYSPQFKISEKELQIAWRKLASAQPRTMLYSNRNTANQLTYIQHTKLLRYPDIITVRFIELSEKQSTLAIYSRSIYGRSDYGVNKARIDQWMAELNRLLKRQD